MKKILCTLGYHKEVTKSVEVFKNDMVVTENNYVSCERCKKELRVYGSTSTIKPMKVYL